MREREINDWRALCPDLIIEGSNKGDTVSLSSEVYAKISDQIRNQGYLYLEPCLDQELVARLRQGMEQLKAADIAPVYIYLFDEPWQLFESLRPLLSHILGEGFGLLPNFWAWHLSEPGQTGWPPHKDCDAQTVFQIGDDTLLMSLSLWIPLTDVTEDNGCMYVVPRNQEAVLLDGDIPSRDALKDIGVPLPAKAGSVMGWPQDLVHWGGGYKDTATEPRISLSFEFQNMAFDPLATPILSTADLPSFADRKRLLDLQFSKYTHIDPTLSGEG